ncbi:cation:proton antiporter [Solwaraspora sp. WMMD406]|uniref:cation:proton antiporter domain-containing protein n=1 Tax=Solwaraspora sp. WMMD406 TaxID=3016095 RepID=UPI002415BC93|nr:cation:proton antiporter [Solwaraspora sp. WMMD406]MDG4763263.1 cation:proton antiporter [Solwaraspora sp. WMMD406]
MRSLHLGYTLVGVLAVLLAFWSSAIRRAPVSEPLLALLLGVLAGPVLGLIDLTDQRMAGLTLETTRILLAISLMAVALRFSATAYRTVLRPIGVLLVAGMAGMALIGAGLAWSVLGLPAALAVLLGACLTPTDPVLASSVVSGQPAEQSLPARLRQVISGESGANDGLAFLFVVLALIAAVPRPAGEQLFEAAWGVVGAVLVGLTVGYVAGRAVRAAEAREQVDKGSLLIFAAVLGVAALGIARMAGTDAVLAVFVTGLAYNRMIGQESRASEQRLDDALTRYLVLPVFFLLGLELPWRQWLELGWPAAAFAVAVLLLRRLPVVVVALRPALGMSWRDAVFLGWFGPIGVSALFYLTYSHREGAVDPRLWAAGTLVVALSTVVHGTTATVGRRWYAAR